MSCWDLFLIKPDSVPRCQYVPSCPHVTPNAPLTLLLVWSSFSPDSVAMGPVSRNCVTPKVTKKATPHSFSVFSLAILA